MSAEPVRGRRRRLAELGAAGGVAAVVIAFVAATVAMRGGDDVDVPGLPAPYETAANRSSDLPGPATTTGKPAATSPVTTARPAPTGVYVPGRGRVATATATPTTPVPTTSRASTPVLTSKPGTPTLPPPATSASPSASPTASTTTTPTNPGEPTQPTSPVDPPPVPVP